MATTPTPLRGEWTKLLDAASGADGGDGVLANSPEARRDALWSSFAGTWASRRTGCGSFLRLLSGTVGGDVNEVITMADEATLQASKAQDQRVQIAKRVSDMQAKIVETVVGSMLRDSKLTMDRTPTTGLWSSTARRARS